MYLELFIGIKAYDIISLALTLARILYVAFSLIIEECLIMLRNKKTIFGIVLIVIVTSVVTFFISTVLFIGWRQINPGYNISFDPEKVSIGNIKKFNEVKNVLKEQFYAEVDENKMLEGAISGMADSLGDVYTTYYTKEQMQKLMEISSKSEEIYVGIGANVMMDENGLLTIVEPFEGSPAKEAGMVQGDKIMKVNDEDVTNIRDQDIIISMIKGLENTSVKITAYRPSEGRSIDFDLKRKKIKYVINIKGEILDKNIGYIRIVSFNDKNISKLFKSELDKMLSKGIKGLVIDLRDNPGGYYGEVVRIADRLLPEGKIVYTEDKNKKQQIERSDKQELGLPMAVLINGNSASASEVLAGAIKDHQKGTLIGTRTFGKGLVQDLNLLDDGSGIKVTIARYFTPSGECIHGIGIPPDVEVEVADEYKKIPISQIPRAEDIQLKTGIEVLKAKIG